jgi:chromosome segregation ATPase
MAYCARRFTSELSPALEQLERDKEKLESKLSETTSLVSSLQSRCHGLEKNRQRWAEDVGELEARLDASQHSLQQHKRRLKEHDVNLTHAKKQVEELASRLVQEQETAR